MKYTKKTTEVALHYK